ncbi:hypothetical protein O181_106448 [Austropuccinia psidii MF-1]|uniref:Uncharacterized protein n=1 Tax=Austropuccinia psidii MF-1 TaxID=1389203 RepID=A0A9Q3PLZ3_9BASI|nr:hypothetical protein [Austropuccinia psidii MF-1]
MLEKGWNPRVPYDTFKKDLVDIHPTAHRFKLVLDKERQNASRCMKDSFKYAKEKWNKSHEPPYFKIGDLVLVSTPNFNNITGPKKLKDSFAGPFMIKALHGPNGVQLELKTELMKKQPAFLKTVIKPYSSSDNSKNIKSTRPTKKLSKRWLGPFPILKKVSSHAYHSTSISMEIHPPSLPYLTLGTSQDINTPRLASRASSSNYH